MTQIWGLASASCLIAGSLPCDALADDQAVASEVEQAAHDLIDAAFVAREEVRTGHVTLTGRYFARVDDFELDRPASGSYRFDRDANVFRFDGKVLCNVQINEPGDTSIVPRDGAPTMHEVKYGYCRATEYFARWFQIGPRSVGNVGLFHLSREPELRSWPCDQRSYDAMAFGMLHYHSLEQGAEAVDAYGYWLDQSVQSLMNAGNLATVELRNDDYDYVCTIVIDRELMTPIRLDYGPIERPTEFQSITEWRVISDIAVPVRYSATLTLPGSFLRTWEFELDWLSVNEDIPDDEFEYTAFTDIPPKLHEVWDHRSEPPTLLGQWVSDGVVEPYPWQEGEE